MTRRVVGLFAHPDDDTYGVGGALARHAGSGVEVTIVLTTSGEAGQIADPSLATRPSLGPVREDEDRRSWAALGHQPDLRFLRYPDGGVAGVPAEDLVAAYLDVLLEIQPDVVVTFGPDGVTGHADHVAVGAAATDAFHLARARAEGGLHRLLYTVLSESRLVRLNERLRARGLEALDPSQALVPRGVPDRSVGMTVDCAEVFDRKVEALRCHRTQSEMEDIPYELWPEVLGREEFHVAWPERPAAEPALTDVFEGLPPT